MDARRLESALSTHRYFGRADYLGDCVLALYRRRLSRLGTAFEAPRILDHLLQLDQAAPLFVRDPAFRSAVDQALLLTRGESAHLDAERVERVLRDAPLRGTPLLARSHAGEPVVIWHAGPTDTAAERAMAELLSTLLPWLSFCGPSAREKHTLERGERLLQCVLPELAASALEHVAVIAVAETQAKVQPQDHGGPRFFRSATLAALPGTMLLSRQVLESAWPAAAALLHEALHLKFIDLEYTHTLGSATELAPITPPWRPEDRWPVKRAMTAAHVYLGLSSFYTETAARGASLAQVAGEDCPRDLDVLARTAIERARYLSAALAQRAPALGAAGRGFIAWLFELADGLA